MLADAAAVDRAPASALQVVPLLDAPTSPIRLAAAHAGVTEVEIKERKLMLTRNGKYVMLNGKFPRLKEKAGHKQLAEALQMLRSL